MKTSEKSSQFALIVDGGTLLHVFNDLLIRENFLKVCLRCEAVLCCRMSPKQKADVVKLVKHSKGSPITCAIGDGANDVSMIQEAHVGLGIFGKEGRNAAISADFAFAKFKFLKRILFVHGYLYYTRLAIMVQYFLYKVS
jgi:P-type E1-E2 ATPase